MSRSAHRQVRAVVASPTEHVVLDQGHRLAVLTGEKQRPDFREVLAGGGVVVAGVGGTRPEGGFVERQPFGGYVPEDHRAESAIADRQRFQPAFGGLTIP